MKLSPNQRAWISRLKGYTMCQRAIDENKFMLRHIIVKLQNTKIKRKFKKKKRGVTINVSEIGMVLDFSTAIPNSRRQGSTPFNILKENNLQIGILYQSGWAWLSCSNRQLQILRCYLCISVQQVPWLLKSPSISMVERGTWPIS